MYFSQPPTEGLGSKRKACPSEKVIVLFPVKQNKIGSFQRAQQCSRSQWLPMQHHLVGDKGTLSTFKFLVACSSPYTLLGSGCKEA